jgi:hypothetical protein
MTVTAARSSAIALFLCGVSAYAHRVDEYLQATKISVEKDTVRAEIRLTPGVAVLPIVLATIDTDRNGVMSDSEQLAYARRVLGDLALTVDGDRLPLRILSTRFPKAEDLDEGLGEIAIDVEARVPRRAAKRHLTFENRHEPRIAAYLVNCLASRDPDITIEAQKRNYEQSRYELDYLQGGESAGLTSPAWSVGPVWAGAAALFLLARLMILWRKRAPSDSPLL